MASKSSFKVCTKASSAWDIEAWIISNENWRESSRQNTRTLPLRRQKKKISAILFLAEEMLFQLISSPTQRERGNISKYLVCHILSFSSKLHILSRVATKLVLSWDILHFAPQTWQSWLQLEYQTVKFWWQKSPCLFQAVYLNFSFLSMNMKLQTRYICNLHTISSDS